MDTPRDDAFTRPFSNTEALQFGWRTTQANLTPLVTLSAIGGALALLGRILSAPERGIVFFPLLGPGVQVLQVALALAFIRVSFRLHDGQPVDLHQPAGLLDGFFPYLLTSVLYGLIVAAVYAFGRLQARAASARRSPAYPAAQAANP